MIYIVLALLIFWGFSSNVLIGIAVSVISLGFIIYKALPGIYAILGNRAYNRDDIEETFKYYEKATASGRAKPGIHLTYLLILMRNNKLDKALQVANNIVINRNSKLSEKYLAKEYRCLIYFKQGEKEEALEDAKEIFESFKNTTIYGLLGYLMLACDEPITETMDFCLKAYDYNSDDRDIVDNLVLAYYKNGELSKAEELSLELLEEHPTFVEAHYHAALIAKALGKNADATAYLEDMDDCIRTALTTVSEEEIENLKNELSGV